VIQFLNTGLFIYSAAISSTKSFSKSTETNAGKKHSFVLQNLPDTHAHLPIANPQEKKTRFPEN
jgi:hypothetical protein